MQLQLLLFAALAFVVLIKLKVYPAEIRSTNLDTDWVYRRLLPVAIGGLATAYAAADTAIRNWFVGTLQRMIKMFGNDFDEKGILGRPWSTNAMAVWAAILLGVCLMLYYF